MRRAERDFMETGCLKADKLQKVVFGIFGDEYFVQNSERLLGGAQKHVYKVQCTNNFTFVLYIWHKDTTYFEDSDDYGFTSNSAELFEVNSTFMIDNGINTPKLYFMDRTKKEHDFEYAIVEYIDGADLDFIAAEQPDRLKPALESLNSSIKKMHSIIRSQAGTVNNPLVEPFSCLNYVLDGAQKNIEYLITNFAPAENIQERINECLSLLYESSIDDEDDTNGYSFIHYELGPNHVIVSNKNIAYLIDIEGAKFFDLEYEHSWLKFRFDENYKHLANDDSSDSKMEYYMFCHHLGVLAGAHELSMKDFYDMDEVNGMIYWNFEQVKSFCDKYLG